MHFHVIRRDYDTRTGHDLPPIEVGIADEFTDARAVVVQDEKQFRLPTSDRFLLHDWCKHPCHDDSHVPGPTEKGHTTR